MVNAGTTSVNRSISPHKGLAALSRATQSSLAPHRRRLDSATTVRAPRLIGLFGGVRYRLIGAGELERRIERGRCSAQLLRKSPNLNGPHPTKLQVSALGDCAISPTMNPSPSPLVACHECDLLQRRVALAPGARACCPRCGALLYSEPKGSLDHHFAWILTTTVLFLLANAFPIVKLELQGQVNAATLIGAAQALWNQDMAPVAALVLVTLVIGPALEVGALLYLVAPLRFGLVAPGFARVFRLSHALGPWQMFDVFMLGIIVSVVKLGHLASVEPGLGLWAFFGLMFASVATAICSDAQSMWARADATYRGASSRTRLSESSS